MTDHSKTLAAAADKYRRATKTLEDARSALVKAVQDAANDEVRQVDILKATGHVWTREQVRRVVAVRPGS